MGLNWNEITVSIFGSLGVVGAVSYFAKEIIVHKLKASIDLENNNRLEIIKNDLNNNQMILAGVLSAQKEGYNISNQERLDAVKLYWNHYVDLISEYYNISSFDSVITIKEVNNLNTNPKAKEIFVSIVKELRTIKHFEIDSDLMAVKRVLPFITKNLWSHLGFLEGFLKRINFLYSKGIEEDNIRH